MTDDRNNGAPMDEGWIKKHRSVRDHWLVGHGLHVKPADPNVKRCHTKGEAWEDLLMECRYEDGMVSNGGVKMELRRGELLGAVSWLANRWNWTPKTVRGFLDALETDGMIVMVRPQSREGTQKGRQSNVVSVCKYDVYQGTGYGEGRPDGQTKGDQRATRGRPEGDIYKEEERKKGRKESPHSPPMGGDGQDVALPSSRSRGKRLPSDWVLPRSWGEWALEHYEATADDIRTEAAGFADYWKSRAGAQACKLDWSATWRNWIRTAAGRRRWPIRNQEVAAAPDLVADTGTMIDRAKKIAALDDAHQREIVARHANGIWPMDKLLYPPGHPKCVIRPQNYRAAGIDENTYDENGIRREGGGAHGH